MNIIDAWNVLGTDPESVFNSIKTGKTLEEKIKIAEKKLEEACSIAKKLRVVYHPDKNQNDPEATKRFKRVTEALSIIEINTNQMRQKMGSKTKRKIYVVVDKT